MLFSATIAGRPVPIQVRQEDTGEFACEMPCEIEPGYYEHRTLRAKSYDGLIGLVNKTLAAGPVIRDLTEAERLELARACVTRKKENLAAVIEAYLRLRIGPYVNENTYADPRYLPVTNEACLFIFFHSEPTTRDSKEFRNFLKTYAQARPYSLPLVKSAWKAFEEKAEEQKASAPPPVTGKQLEQSSDQDVNQTFAAVRRAYAEAERNRRDLLRNNVRLTPEQAIEALRGPEE